MCVCVCVCVWKKVKRKKSYMFDGLFANVFIAFN